MKALAPAAAMLLIVEGALLALLVERPATLAALVAAAGGAWLLAGGGRHWKWVAALLLLNTWLMLLTQGLFYADQPRTALVLLVPPAWAPWADPPGLYLYREGLVHGLVQSLRLDVVVLLGAALVARYAQDELMAGLAGLGLPPALGFLLALVVRYLPLLWAEVRATWVAQRLRGLRLLRRPRAGVGWPGGALLGPLLAVNLRHSGRIAAALAARGFSLHRVPVEAAGDFSRAERALCWSGAALVALVAGGQVLGLLWRTGWPLPPLLEALAAQVVRHV